jgi:hypothetical protein
MEQSRHRKNVDDEIRNNVEDCLSNEWRSFGDAITVVGGKVPVAGYWTEVVSLSA